MFSTSNTLLYVLPAILLVISLTLCGISTAFLKKEKLASYVALKGGSVASIAILGLTVENLLGTNAISGTTTFILIAIVLQIFSAIVATLPSKTNIFEPLYSGLDMGTSLMLSLAGLFLIPLSPLGLPIGLGVGILASVIIALAIRKFNWKTDIFKYSSLALTIGLIGQIILILTQTISVQTILFAIAGIVYLAYTIIKIFVPEKFKGITISKNISYYISLLLFVISIYVVIF